MQERIGHRINNYNTNDGNKVVVCMTTSNKKRKEGMGTTVVRIQDREKSEESHCFNQNNKTKGKESTNGGEKETRRQGEEMDYCSMFLIIFAFASSLCK